MSFHVCLSSSLAYQADEQERSNATPVRNATVERVAGLWAPSVLEIRYGSFRKHPPQAAHTLVSIVKYPHRSLHSVSLAVSVSVKGQRAGPYRRICLSH